MINIDNDNYYECDADEATTFRTRKRLESMSAMGMEEVNFSQFGVTGIMSGLYIEMVWNYSDEDFNSYLNWAQSVINRKL